MIPNNPEVEISGEAGAEMTVKPSPIEILMPQIMARMECKMTPSHGWLIDVDGMRLTTL